MSSLSTGVQIVRTFGIRDGLLRLQYEISRGTGLMSLRMRAGQGWEKFNLNKIAPAASQEEILAGLRGGNQRFFFSDCRSLAPELRNVLGDDGERTALADGCAVLDGTVPFFGRWQTCGVFPLNWFRNPVSGQEVSPTRLWTKMRFAAEDYGDFKFILESSRFLFVYPLARAYALTKDDRFAAAFWIAVEDWAARNPPMIGPLWICGQESSLRILALAFGLHAFAHSPATTPARVALLLGMIAALASRTQFTIGYARSQRSNHLFSEAVGLWTAGTLFPELTRSGIWQQQGARLLKQAVLDQITPEGVHLQHSFNYQRMVLHLLLWTLRLAQVRGLEVDPVIRSGTLAALRFLREFVDVETGHAPNFGANDGTNLFPLSQCEYEDFRPLLQFGARVLGEPPVIPGGPWDESALWFCGCASAPTKIAAMPPDISSEAGYFRIGSRSSWALIRAGKCHRRPFQADQLHVDLWWRGLNLATDAGTYLYNGPPPWDNGLAGTAAHNTVMVDARDTMRRAGRFLWVDWAQASGKSLSVNSSEVPDCFEGRHDGYRRIGIVHRRTVQLFGDTVWFIVDDLFGTGQHKVQLRWLTGDWPCNVLSQQPFGTMVATPLGPVHWNIYCRSKGFTDLVRGGKSLLASDHNDCALQGWHSPTYGELRPAVSLLYSVNAELPQRIVTAIVVSYVPRLCQDRDHLILESGNVIHKLSLVPNQSSAIVQ